MLVLVSTLGMFINFVGWFVSDAWLALLGQWIVIGIGIAAAYVGIELARTAQLRMLAGPPGD